MIVRTIMTTLMRKMMTTMIMNIRTSEDGFQKMRELENKNNNNNYFL